MLLNKSSFFHLFIHIYASIDVRIEIILICFRDPI